MSNQRQVPLSQVWNKDTVKVRKKVTPIFHILNAILQIYYWYIIWSNNVELSRFLVKSLNSYKRKNKKNNKSTRNNLF